jgi:hypothetical protein
MPKQGDGRITDSSQYLRLAAIAHSATVFVKSHIPDIVQLIFYRPVPSCIKKQLVGWSYIWSKACYAVTTAFHAVESKRFS